VGAPELQFREVRAVRATPYGAFLHQPHLQRDRTAAVQDATAVSISAKGVPGLMVTRTAITVLGTRERYSHLFNLKDSTF
jgi:hypothetical protein